MQVRHQSKNRPRCSTLLATKISNMYLSTRYVSNFHEYYIRLHECFWNLLYFPRSIRLFVWIYEYPERRLYKNSSHVPRRRTFPPMVERRKDGSRLQKAAERHSNLSCSPGQNASSFDRGGFVSVGNVRQGVHTTKRTVLLPRRLHFARSSRHVPAPIEITVHQPAYTSIWDAIETYAAQKDYRKTVCSVTTRGRNQIRFYEWQWWSRHVCLIGWEFTGCLMNRRYDPQGTISYENAN